jgi:inner membrane protein
MDNVTHSLAGLLLAEAAVRLRAQGAHTEPSPRFRTVAAVSSLIAANLPDADLFYTGFGGDRLRYMLQHRGYTHTVVIAIVGAVLLWAIAALALRWRARDSPSRDDARWLFGLLLVSILSHLALDWTNSYGIHPFWPIDDRWRYGDAVFIIEPWLWVVSVPALVAASARRLTRIVLSLILLGGLTLAWRVDLVSRGAAIALTVGAVLSIGLARGLRPNARVATAITGWLVVTLVMATAASMARATALRAVREANASAEILDIVVSPLPANAVCLTVITLERSRATYRAATARVSVAPWIADATQCAKNAVAASGLGLSPRRSTSAVYWEGEWSAPSEELATLARESCSALAALRFIRAPIWRSLGDSTVEMGDIRYGGGSGSGFTDLLVPRRSTRCREKIPPWTPPRSDLLEPLWRTANIGRIRQ